MGRRRGRGGEIGVATGGHLSAFGGEGGHPGRYRPRRSHGHQAPPTRDPLRGGRDPRRLDQDRSPLHRGRRTRRRPPRASRSEEHTSELQALMRTSSAVYCLTKKKHTENNKSKTNKY